MTDAKKRERTPEEIARRLPRRPGDEIANLGDEIYRRDIRHLVINDHDGEYVAIDVDTGNWAISDDDLTASNLLRAKCPEATDIYALRVGYVASGSLGGGSPKRDL